MLKVTVVKNEHQRKELPSKNNKVRILYEQKAYVHLQDEPYPKEIKVTQWVDSDGVIPEPFPKGEYKLCPSSFYVGKYGVLQCSPKLVPLKPAA